MARHMPVELTHKLARQIRQLVFLKAKQFKVPAAFITAHIRSNAADAARIEVWRVMIGEMGMTRQQVAHMFMRDRRRLRKSVIGI